MIETIISGGPMMIFLLACSIAALAVILDRVKAYYDNDQVDTRALRADVLALLAENRLNNAITLCASTPGPTSAVLLVGLRSYEKLLSVKATPEAVRTIVSKAMEDYYPHALNAVEKRLNILSTVGNAAPLFGMTGTVTGMIKSFGALAESGMNAKLVGAGIAEALITTAAGLLIALGAVIPYNMFMARVEKIGLEMEEAAAEMAEFITMQAERRASK
jgi:biopolymer transport protein ExbB